MHNVSSVFFHVALTSGTSIKGHPKAMNMPKMPRPAGPPPNRLVILHSGNPGEGYQQFHMQPVQCTMHPGKTRTSNLHLKVYFTRVL